MRSPRSPFSKILSDLTRLQGVTAALVASERDGLAIDAASQVGVDTDAVAALATTLHRKATLAGGAARHGNLVFLQLEADRGRICVSARDELLLITVADPRANVGLLRVAMLTAIRAAAFALPADGPRLTAS